MKYMIDIYIKRDLLFGLFSFWDLIANTVDAAEKLLLLISFPGIDVDFAVTIRGSLISLNWENLTSSQALVVEMQWGRRHTYWNCSLIILGNNVCCFVICKFIVGSEYWNNKQWTFQNKKCYLTIYTHI